MVCYLSYKKKGTKMFMYLFICAEEIKINQKLKSSVADLAWVENG
jgi:hypothetical protein